MYVHVYTPKTILGQLSQVAGWAVKSKHLCLLPKYLSSFHLLISLGELRTVQICIILWFMNLQLLKLPAFKIGNQLLCHSLQNFIAVANLDFELKSNFIYTDRQTDQVL